MPWIWLFAHWCCSLAKTNWPSVIAVPSVWEAAPSSDESYCYRGWRWDRPIWGPYSALPIFCTIFFSEVHTEDTLVWGVFCRVAKSLVRFVLCTEADPKNLLKNSGRSKKWRPNFSLWILPGAVLGVDLFTIGHEPESESRYCEPKIRRFSKVALKLNSNQNTINLLT